MVEQMKLGNMRARGIRVEEEKKRKLTWQECVKYIFNEDINSCRQCHLVLRCLVPIVDTKKRNMEVCVKEYMDKAN